MVARRLGPGGLARSDPGSCARGRGPWGTFRDLEVMHACTRIHVYVCSIACAYACAHACADYACAIYHNVHGSLPFKCINCMHGARA